VAKLQLAREDMSNFLFTSMTGTKVIQRMQVSTLLRSKICAGTILPSFEHNWLKYCSHMTSMIRRDNWLGFRSLWL